MQPRVSALPPTQVDVHERVIVIDISEDRTGMRAFVNPVIVEAAGRSRERGGLPFGAGCVRQGAAAERVKVRALTAGRAFHDEAGGAARCMYTARNRSPGG